MKTKHVTRILVVVNDFDIGKKIEKLASKSGIICDVIDSIFEISQYVLLNKYSGFLIDMDILSRTNPEDRPMIERYRSLLNYARFIYEYSSDSVEIFYKDEVSHMSVKEFSLICEKEIPRKLRSDTRRPISFNVRLLKDLKEDSDKGKKAHTINISEGGCFIATKAEFKINSTIGIIFAELSDKNPILARVIWKTKGGSNFLVAGIGLKFEKISSRQHSELISHLITFNGIIPELDSGIFFVLFFDYNNFSQN
ncbi:MAG: PilZ domain-containing protein [Candidatus Gracilibacteria bacterium]|nr:PilZ domain-containing protein [Candidatus Gracilibacteria bacterium]